MDPAENPEISPSSIPTYTPEDLCRYCRDLDLEAAFSIPTKVTSPWLGRKSRPLNPAIHGWETLKLESPLCQMFSNLRLEDPDKSREPKRFYLRQKRAADLFDPLYGALLSIPARRKIEHRIRKSLFQDISGRVLVVEPTENDPLSLQRRPDPFPRLIFECGSEFGSKRIYGCLPESKFDVDKARKWIKHCLETDTHNRCSVQERSEQGIPRVIDCSTKKLLQLPASADYVCLSYCWGDFQPAPLDADQLVDLPLTIVDAISVVLDLGFKYIWIDAYCIDQNNTLAKHIEIKRMDKIFSGAALTIIAAAGKSAHHGLSGISRPWNTTSLRTFRVGRTTLLTGLRSPRARIQASHWDQRGWTYQEGMLSNRRLVFTEQEALFQCRAMFVTSSIHWPEKFTEMWYGPHDTRNRRLRSYPSGARWRVEEGWITRSLAMFDDINSSFPIQNLSTWHSISNYLPRKLSYEEDIINAVSGILNTSKQGSHYFGLPYNINLLDDTDEFCQNLLWQPKFSLVPSGVNLSVHRRIGYPSWSWSGWKDWNPSISHIEAEQIWVRGDVNVPISVHDGTRIVCLSEFLSKGHQHDILTEQSGHFLILDTFLLRARIVMQWDETVLGRRLIPSWSSKFELLPEVEGKPSEGWQWIFQNKDEVPPDLDPGRVFIMVLYLKVNRDQVHTRCLVIARRRASSERIFGDLTEIYERIGSGDIYFTTEAYEDLRRTKWSHKQRIVLG